MNRAGFTLIEILAAMAILGTALFVLMNAHYGALSLHSSVDEEVTFRQLLETIVARADTDIMSGTLANSGEFGARYPGFSWSFEAVPAGADEMVLLYDVTVAVRGPEETRELHYAVYDIGMGSTTADTGNSAQDAPAGEGNQSAADRRRTENSRERDTGFGSNRNRSGR